MVNLLRFTSQYNGIRGHNILPVELYSSQSSDLFFSDVIMKDLRFCLLNVAINCMSIASQVIYKTIYQMWADVLHYTALYSCNIIHLQQNIKQNSPH